MPISDLIPWKKDETSVPIRRGREEDALLDLRKQMNRLFDDFFERPFNLSPFFRESAYSGVFAPHIDVSEDNKEVKISAELPGMEPEDINITLDAHMLTISGEKRSEKEEKDQRYYRVERSYGSFQRSIPLPEGIQEEKIDATFKRGVLVIKLPKSVEAQKKSKKISINTG
jgi:HSP20 family protein